ncbi:MAG: DUF1559 domain-containing protein [Phycisphaerales bacterium]|nr:DUF1559 domain-containing protein [Phycisphaerales bacterium]
MRRHGFTLVETLVVVGLVALLLGLLLPALGRVRAGARTTRCLSQLRQLSLAAQQYASVFSEWPAAVRYERAEGGPLEQVAWDWHTTFDGTLIGPGPLWAFTGDPDAVMQCPDYLGGTNFTADPFTGYDYNTSYIGDEERWAPDGAGEVRRGVRPHACRRSSCAMFGDGGWAGGTHKFMRAPMGPEGDIAIQTTYSGGQAFRHLGSTNVAHVDGHVSVVGQAARGTRATDALLEGFLGYPGNGFLSDDDRAYDPR